MRAVLDRPFVIALEMRAKLLGPVNVELLEPVEQPSRICVFLSSVLEQLERRLRRLEPRLDLQMTRLGALFAPARSSLSFRMSRAAKPLQEQGPDAGKAFRSAIS